MRLTRLRIFWNIPAHFEPTRFAEYVPDEWNILCNWGAWNFHDATRHRVCAWSTLRSVFHSTVSEISNVTRTPRRAVENRLTNPLDGRKTYARCISKFIEISFEFYEKRKENSTPPCWFTRSDKTSKYNSLLRYLCEHMCIETRLVRINSNGIAVKLPKHSYSLVLAALTIPWSIPPSSE